MSIAKFSNLPPASVDEQLSNTVYRTDVRFALILPFGMLRGEKNLSDLGRKVINVQV